MAEVKRITQAGVTVEYEAFVSDDGSQRLQETISIEYMWRIRPPVPQCCLLDEGTGSSPLLGGSCPPKPGETVDVNDKDCW